MLLKYCPVQLLPNAGWVIINTYRPASFVFLFIVFQWERNAGTGTATWKESVA
jgi:hypothetical protein